MTLTAVFANNELCSSRTVLPYSYKDLILKIHLSGDDKDYYLGLGTSINTSRRSNHGISSDTSSSIKIRMLIMALACLVFYPYNNVFSRDVLESTFGRELKNGPQMGTLLLFRMGKTMTLRYFRAIRSNVPKFSDVKTDDAHNHDFVEKAFISQGETGER
ncbi:hypothetical protein Tco_0382062 [Tanacetum coccineum]